MNMISTGFEFLRLGLVALLIFVFVGYATTCRDEEILMEKEQEPGGNEDPSEQNNGITLHPEKVTELELKLDALI